MDDPTSSSTVSAEARGEAVFAAREPGVVAGLGVAALTFFMLGADATVTDRVPDGTRVAKGDVVMRVTGLTHAEWARGVEASRVWRWLQCAASQIARESGGAFGVATAVIHFARFEEPFLRALHASHGMVGTVTVRP